MGLTLAFHLLAAVFSDGFHHADEHFQILEFSAAQVLTSAPSVWEYEAEMRPWLLPSVVTVLIETWRAFGVDDPLLWAMSFRILSALLSCAALYLLVLCLPGWITDATLLKVAIPATCLIWFLPYLDARGSGENWSGTLFLLGFAPLLLAEQHVQQKVAPTRHYWLLGFACGLCWGLAFHCRYHIAVACIGATLWLIVYSRLPKTTLIALVCGSLGALYLGGYLDALGYNHWVLTAWNYFEQNILLDKASDFGVDPFYFYIQQGLIQGIPPISIVLLAGPVLCWILLPKHPLTWITLPFVLLHLLVPHKELRFLFPIAVFAVPMAFLALNELARDSHFIRQRIVKLRPVTWSPLIVLNFVAMIIVSAVPARVDIDMYRTINALSPDRIYAWQESPYQWHGLTVSFYRPEALQVDVVTDSHALSNILRFTEEPVWITVKDFSHHALDGRCSLISRNLPGWLTAPYLQDYAWHKKLRIISLFQCEPTRNAIASRTSTQSLIGE